MEVEMKTIWFCAMVLITLAMIFTACVEVPNAIPTAAPTQPVEPMATVAPTVKESAPPLVELTGEGFCHSGPGTGFVAVALLEKGSYLVYQQTEGESAWFKIDPNAIINPDPPLFDPNALLCWVAGNGLLQSGDFTGVPTVMAPRLGVVNATGCYASPGVGHLAIASIEANSFFDVIAIDDDVTWFEINPNAIIDPDPPTSPIELQTNQCPYFFQETPRCWIQSQNVITSGDLSILPEIHKPEIKTLENTKCYDGAGIEFSVIATLNPNQYFDLIAIDDEVTWAGNNSGSGLAFIDDEVTWLGINPNAIVDPEPPTEPTNELSPQPDPPGMTLQKLCWVPKRVVEVIGDIHSVPVAVKPILEVNNRTYCYSAPGINSKAKTMLNVNDYFKIIGIDDEVTWDSHGMDWFQINFTELIDPEPPTRPLNGVIDPEPPTSVRCWVPGSSVSTCGDISFLPVIYVPLIAQPTAVSIFTPTPQQNSGWSCSNYKTQLDCNKMANYGCVWNDKLGCYKP
jgi:hypothetical protein